MKKRLILIDEDTNMERIFEGDTCLGLAINEKSDNSFNIHGGIIGYYEEEKILLGLSEATVSFLEHLSAETDTEVKIIMRDYLANICEKMLTVLESERER